VRNRKEHYMRQQIDRPFVEGEPSGPWQPGHGEFKLDGSLTGRDDIGWGAVTTADQTMSGELRMSSYKLNTSSTKNDWFAVFGHMIHGIAHGNKVYESYSPADNWLSVGYYAPSMSLVLELQPNGTIWDSGPTSTVGSDDITGFEIGGGLNVEVSKDGPGGGDSSNPSFSASFYSRNVTTEHAAVGKISRWDLKLPGVGFISPANPPNPEPPSYVGYDWYFAAIFEVDKGTNLQLRVHPRVVWEFDCTRGTTNDTKTWEDDKTYTHEPA
jgi:hypothetical protein